MISSALSSVMPHYAPCRLRVSPQSSSWPLRARETHRASKFLGLSAGESRPRPSPGPATVLETASRPACARESVARRDADRGTGSRPSRRPDKDAPDSRRWAGPDDRDLDDHIVELAGPIRGSMAICARLRSGTRQSCPLAVYIENTGIVFRQVCEIKLWRTREALVSFCGMAYIPAGGRGQRTV